MPPEGMVHALEKIYRLLKPDGRLIDIHPSGQPPPIEVRLGSHIFQTGWLREKDDYIEYEQANQAITQVVKQQLFAVEKQGRFAFETCSDSLAELRAFLAENWQDAIIDDRVAGEIEAQMASIEPDKKLVIKELILINRLRPLSNDPRKHTNSH